jgi:hypothetical protein
MIRCGIMANVPRKMIPRLCIETRMLQIISASSANLLLARNFQPQCGCGCGCVRERERQRKKANSLLLEFDNSKSVALLVVQSVLCCRYMQFVGRLACLQTVLNIARNADTYSSTSSTLHSYARFNEQLELLQYHLKQVQDPV